MSSSKFAPALALLCAPLLAAPLAAQTSAEFALLFSTSGSAELPDHPVTDQELVSHSPSEGTRAAWPLAALLGFFGEDTSGVHQLPGDLDAVHDSGAFASAGGLLVSFASDAQGFEDGDVLRLAPEGAEIVYPEELFSVICGATDENVDVDAIQLDADGTLYFSFAEDEDSSFLSGDDPGVIADGDVLRWVEGAGQAEMHLTESQIDALVSAALGSSQATGDVKGLARDPQTGALLFCVQSPSAHDASVFSTAGGGSLLPGFDEAQLEFLDSEEFDALSVRGQAFPALRPETLRPVLGEETQVEVYGAEPGSMQLLLIAFDHGAAWLPTLGWGGLVLADDAMFAHSLMVSGALLRVADGGGRAQWSFDVPLGFPAIDVSAQCFELGTSVRASNPILVEGGQ